MFARLRREPGFYRRVWLLAMPIMLQNLITTSLAFVDTFMVGLLGNAPMAAVTAANSPIFLVQVIVFGLMSGLTVLVSQYWGKGDMEAINRCMGIAMYIALGVSTIAAVLLAAFPDQVMAIVTPNQELIALGAPYLRIVGVSYIFNSVTSVYVAMQRSTENPIFGMQVFGASMLLNTLLNYIFIFGKLGAPAMGVTGAAVATLASRIVEFIIMAVYALRSKRTPLRFSSLLRPGKVIFRSFLRYATPVVCNEALWGLGTATFTAIMGHMLISTEMLAAYAIMGSLDKFAIVACFGLAGSTAIIVGKRIGEGASKDEVYDVSVCMLLLSALVGIAIGLLLLICLPTVFIPWLYPLFKLSAKATEIAIIMTAIYIVTMPMRAFDFNAIIGVLRAGGDARVATLIDLVPLWLLAIPLTAVLALVLDAPVALVCIGIQAENFLKMPLGIRRVRSRKWINDVTRGGKKA